jgi:hypothetical protein
MNDDKILTVHAVPGPKRLSRKRNIMPKPIKNKMPFPRTTHGKTPEKLNPCLKIGVEFDEVTTVFAVILGITAQKIKITQCNQQIHIPIIFINFNFVNSQYQVQLRMLYKEKI